MFKLKNPPAELLDEDGDLNRDSSDIIEIDLSAGTARILPSKDGSGCHMCGLNVCKETS